MKVDPKKLLLNSKKDNPLQLAFLYLSLTDVQSENHPRIQIIKLFQKHLPLKEWPLDKVDTEGISLKTRLERFNSLRVGC